MSLLSLQKIFAQSIYKHDKNTSETLSDLKCQEFYIRGYRYKQVRVGNEKNCLSLTFVVKFIAWNLFFFTFWDIAIINMIFHIFTLEI